MAGFDRLDTAVRVREIIRKGSREQIAAQVPRPLVGRMMTVNLRKLQGTVWFPGDDQPILVNLMQNAIPGDWHYRGHYYTETEDESTVGRGSTVVCQRLNGVLYVVQILSNGQMSYELQTVGLGVVGQRTYDENALNGSVAVDIAGEPSDNFFSADVYVKDLRDENNSVEVGPFVYTGSRVNNSNGWIEISLTGLYLSKHYSFTIARDFELASDRGAVTRWLRLLPDRECVGEITQDENYNVDIAFRYSKPDSLERDIWFRITSSGSSSNASHVQTRMNIRSTIFDKARYTDGTQSLTHKIVNSPAEPWGYLGFYKSRHAFTMPDDGDNADNFGKKYTEGWGVSDRNRNWSYAPSSAAFSSDAEFGLINLPSNNVTQYAVLSSLANSSDWYALVSMDDFSLTQPVWGGITFDFNPAGSNDCWMAGLAFKPDGTGDLFLRKKISGTTTLVDSDTNVASYSNDKNYKWWIRVHYELDAVNSSRIIKVKTWHTTQMEPQLWHIEQTVASGSSPATQVNSGLFAHAVTGNTNTKPVGVYFQAYRQSGDYFNTSDTVNGFGIGLPWRGGPFESAPKKLASALQKLWTLEGTIRYDVSDLLDIRGRIHLDGPGAHVDGLRNTYAYIDISNNQSGNSLGRPIPVMPFDEDDENSGFRTWYVDEGIPLYPGESLWCGIPPGAGMENLARYLFILNGYSADNVNGIHHYSIPEWAILIAQRTQSETGPVVRLGNGEHLDYWRTASLQNGWTNHGGGTSPPLMYRKIGYNQVHVRGYISSGTTTGGTVITTLPVGYRPMTDEDMVAASGSHDLSVFPNGEIQYWGGGGGFVKVNGIFAVDNY